MTTTSIAEAAIFRGRSKALIQSELEAMAAAGGVWSSSPDAAAT